jgi:hypothetical protein
LRIADLANAAANAEDAMLELHPSLGVVRSSYPIVSIFELNTRGEDMLPVRLEGAEDALVLRPKLEVEVRRLPEGGASFILALREKKTLGEAAAIAFAVAPEFVLEFNLAGMIASGAIIGLSADPTL